MTLLKPIKIRFVDNYMWSLSPIEKLTIYKGNKIVKSKNNYFKKDYIPNSVFSKSEQKNLRPGFFNQIKNIVIYSINFFSCQT